MYLKVCTGVEHLERSIRGLAGTHASGSINNNVVDNDEQAESASRSQQKQRPIKARESPAAKKGFWGLQP